MPPIEVIYEHGVFRPLQPVELAEGVRGQVSVIGVIEHGEQGERVGSRRQQSPQVEVGHGTERGEPLVGEELAALLDQIADLPHTPHPDGRTDVSTHHDDILYPKHGQMP